MKTRTLLSTLAVIIFGFLAGASIDENGNLSGWVWFILITAIIIFVVMLIAGFLENEKSQAKAAEAEQARMQRIAEQEKAYKEWYDKYIDKKGIPDKIIIVKPSDSSEVIFVHEASKKIFMLGSEYNFKEIMSCTFSDSPTTIKGKITSTTKSSTGSTVGRAIVGDLVAGPAGAIIGGTTGKKKTEFHQESDKVIHNYTVIVNINSISKPIVLINTGSDGKLTNEIVGLMNVIIARK